MQASKRDAEIVGWIGRIGAAAVDHVSERFEMGEKVAYGRLKMLANEGLLCRHNLLYQRPGLFVATAAGLRWRGLARLGVVRLNPGSFEHAWEVARAAVALHFALPGWDVLGEREIRAYEKDEERLLASARVPRSGPYRMFHHPDLAIVSPSGRVAAIEVELTTKSAGRMKSLCRDWSRAAHVGQVYYLSPQATARAVQRAAKAAKAEHRLTVLGPSSFAALAELEIAEESKTAGHAVAEPGLATGAPR